MKLLNIGFGNMVNADRIIGIVSPDSAPIKRLVQDAREKGALIDASYGRRTQAVLIMDSDHVILSGIPLESLTGRANEETEEKRKRSELEGRMKLGIPVIIVIEVEGAGNIKKMYPGATTIFVLPPDMQELERRLRCRGTEDEETIQRRLKRAETEIANSVNYDEHVVNIEVDSCAESIYSIIQFKLQHGSDE